MSFETLCSSIMVAGLFYLIYHTFLYSTIEKKIKTIRDKIANKSVSEKIAQVKLISDDPKDIERFISANARYLSDKLVKRLVSRIEMIKCDQIILEDTLQTRIDIMQESLSEFEVEPETSIRHRR
jgi:hypothetical protein